MKTFANTRRDGYNYDCWEEVNVLPSVAPSASPSRRYQDEEPYRSLLPSTTSQKVRRGGSSMIGKAIEVIKETAHEHVVSPAVRASKVQKNKKGLKSASNLRDEVLRGREMKEGKVIYEGNEDIWKFTALYTAAASTHAPKDLACESMNEVTIDRASFADKTDDDWHEEDESSYYSSDDDESTVFSEAKDSLRDLNDDGGKGKKKEEENVIPSNITNANASMTGRYVAPKYVFVESRMGKGMTYRVPKSLLDEIEDDAIQGKPMRTLSLHDIRRLNILPCGYNDKDEDTEEEVR